MKLEFCKMQGAGNDFVVIDNRIARLTPEQMPLLARKVCARRTSVGADGLMVADQPERGGDAKMWFFNSDGSVGEMCGNGARCFGRFVYEHFAAKDEIIIEATSSIDTRTEQKIQSAFARLMQGRTSFIVAHRLSTIREADVILVMRDGHVVEQGTHDQLLAKGGFYATLWNSQFAH